MIKPLEWKFSEGSAVQANLSFADDYVISHRPNEFNVSYRPPGQHHHVGCGKTLLEAEQLAEAHQRSLNLDDTTKAVIDLLLLAASEQGGNGSISVAIMETAPDEDPETQRIIGLAFDACALLCDSDDYEEDETDPEYPIHTKLEAAQRLADGRIVLAGIP
jgi:hypothetical protein